MGSDAQRYLNEITVNSFEAMQLGIRLRSMLKTRILTFIRDEDAPIEVNVVVVDLNISDHH